VQRESGRLEVTQRDGDNDSNPAGSNRERGRKWREKEREEIKA
jgi:hypothetical protein